LDVKRDILSFQFRSGDSDSLRPSPSLIGHVDWPACWKFRKIVAEDENNLSREPVILQHAQRVLGQPLLDVC
jgi:hypothetical protein